jgi:hypothetical protein
MGIEEVIMGVALAGSLAGTGMSMAASADSKKKMNQVTDQQIASTQALQKKATPIYEANLNKSTNVDSTLQGAQQQALAEYQELSSQPNTTVAQDTGEKSQITDARTQASNARAMKANAAIQQYPALGSVWAQGNMDTNPRLGNINAQGQTLGMAYPALLSSAQQSGQSQASIGSLINSISGLAGTYAMSQGAMGKVDPSAPKSIGTQGYSGPVYDITPTKVSGNDWQLAQW